MPVIEMISWAYAESPDGRWLYTCGAGQKGTGYGALWRTPVDGGKTEEIVRPFSFGTIRFRTDGLYFLDRKGRPRGSPPMLKRLAPERREVTEVAPVNAIGSHFSLSPDLTSVLSTQGERFQTDLLFVDEFR